MCQVVVSNMIVGVNIVLGNAQPIACPAFQNASGTVDVAQLIKGVNNLLSGCNPDSCVGPTGTPTVSPTETPTQGPTLHLPAHQTRPPGVVWRRNPQTSRPCWSWPHGSTCRHFVPASTCKSRRQIAKQCCFPRCRPAIVTTTICLPRPRRRRGGGRRLRPLRGFPKLSGDLRQGSRRRARRGFGATLAALGDGPRPRRRGPVKEAIFRIYVDDEPEPCIELKIGDAKTPPASLEIFAAPFGANTSINLAWYYPVVFSKKLIVSIDNIPDNLTWYQASFVLDEQSTVHKRATERLPARTRKVLWARLGLPFRTRRRLCPQPRCFCLPIRPSRWQH